MRPVVLPNSVYLLVMTHELPDDVPGKDIPYDNRFVTSDRCKLLVVISHSDVENFMVMAFIISLEACTCGDIPKFDYSIRGSREAVLVRMSLSIKYGMKILTSQQILGHRVL